MTGASDAARALRAIPSEARAEASRANGAKGGRPRATGPRNADLRPVLSRAKRWSERHRDRVTPRLRAARLEVARLLAVSVYRRDAEATSAALRELVAALRECRERATAP